MQRYLMRLSFSGQKFHGSQKQTRRIQAHLWTEDYIKESLLTVQGALETALLTLHPHNEVSAFMASRVDAGVHAFNMPCSVDLQMNEAGDAFYDPKIITYRMNKAFQWIGIDVNILKTEAVPGDFVCRKAQERTYVYKFAVRKCERSCLPCFYQPYITEAPLNFNLDKAINFLQTITGKELNFEAFSKVNARITKSRNDDGSLSLVTLDEDHLIRTITESKLVKVRPPIESIPFYADTHGFYELVIKSKSFYRNQIRILVYMMFSVASGKVNQCQIEEMFQDPKCSNKPIVRLADPNGLYLMDVQYDPSLVAQFTEDVTKLPILPQPMPINDFTRLPIRWDQMSSIMRRIFPKDKAIHKKHM